MDKKLFYEAPETEIVEVKVEGFLCGSPTGGGSEDIPGDNIDPNF